MELLGSLLTSKKFVASLGAVVAVAAMKLAGKFGVVLDQATADEISKAVCVLVSTYVVAQGIADHGKEAAKINAAAGADARAAKVADPAKVLVEDKPAQPPTA